MVNKGGEGRTRSRRWLRQLAGVALAGGLGWLVDMLILWLLAARLGAPTSISAVVGFVSSAVVNFWINNSVFRGRGSRPRSTHASRYVVLLALNTLAVAVLVPVLEQVLDSVVVNLDLLLLGAKVLTTAVLLPFNFLAYRHWVFVAPPDRTGPAEGA